MAQTVSQPRAIFPKKMTYEDYLELNLGEGVHTEWVNGEIEFKYLTCNPETGELELSVSQQHTLLNGFLVALLRFFVEHFQLGRIYFDPFQMKTGPNLPGREPDVTFVATANLGRVTEQYTDGPADLAVEIVSPDSVTRDRVTKLGEYEQGGVREYWIADPLVKEALFYQLGADGKYILIAPDENGIYHSTVLPNLWIKVEWLWEETRPSLMDVLKAWQLM
jgi:Uma2 family endonuclease